MPPIIAPAVPLDPAAEKIRRAEVAELIQTPGGIKMWRIAFTHDRRLDFFRYPAPTLRRLNAP